MPSSKEYLAFVLEQLSGLEQISFRAMMGEYVIYYRDKVIGGIYDNRFLLKPVSSVVAMMPDAAREIPYPGAKAMIHADIDDRELTVSVIQAMYDALPAVKKRKK
ncbi:MAG: TfoX/Sxy family protein [Proteobacteria bacterium]|nr:TfoX/Sxy family protein [Pseudomonadota bacterium]